MVMTVIMVMVVDKISNKKVNQILIGGRKLNTSTVLIKQSYIIIPKYV